VYVHTSSVPEFSSMTTLVTPVSRVSLKILSVWILCFARYFSNWK